MRTWRPRPEPPAPSGNIDGDKVLDLVTANSGTSSALVRTGKGDGTFNAAAVFHSVNGTQPYGVAVADLNGDQRPDLLLANNASNNVYAYLGKGGAAFGADDGRLAWPG